MLFGRSKGEQFKRDDFLEKITALQEKCSHLEKKFRTKAENDNEDTNNQLAQSCSQAADALKECADLISQMLPPRGKHKAKAFESKFNELLRKADDLARESEIFDYPVANGTLEATVNDLRSLIFDIIEI